MSVQESSNEHPPDDPPSDGMPRFGSVATMQDGYVPIWIRKGRNLPQTVTIRSARRLDMVVEPSLLATFDPKNLGYTHLFKAIDYVLPGELLYVYYGNTDILLEGSNPQRIPARISDQRQTQSDDTGSQANDGRKQHGGTPMERDQIHDMIAVSVAQTDTKFERLLGEMRETAARQDAKFDALSTKIDASQVEARTGRTEARSNRNVILWTVVPVIVTTGIALGGLVYASQANFLSAFQAGIALRSVSPSATDTTK